MRWTVLIPAKALPYAKSRLLPATRDRGGVDQAAHARLVEAIRADTAAAALAAPVVARVVLVVDSPAVTVPAGTALVVQRRPGLNAALSDAADDAARDWPLDGVAALLGDLPSLTADELTDTLHVAAGHDAGYVPDADGTGTTLLTARPGARLSPQFGAGSAERHARVAHLLPAGPGVRRDVDTVADLDAAIALGLGPATGLELTVAGYLLGSPGHGASSSRSSASSSANGIVDP